MSGLCQGQEAAEEICRPSTLNKRKAFLFQFLLRDLFRSLLYLLQKDNGCIGTQRINIVCGLPSGNASNRKLMVTAILHQCDDCQSPSALLIPLFFFFQPCSLSMPSGGAPNVDHSQKTWQPLCPQMLPFPLYVHFYIFNEEREPGSNVRTKHKTWLQQK